MGSIIEIFKDDLRETSRAVDVYSALCNNIWERDGEKMQLTWRSAAAAIAEARNSLNLKIEDQEVCQRCGKKASEHFKQKEETFLTKIMQQKGEDFHLISLRCQEGADDLFTAGYRGHEDYLDFYCTGKEGTVEPWVKEKMNLAGWKSTSL